MSESKWNELSKSNEDKFTISELKFIFSEAEKFLKQTFDISTTIVTRSTIFLSTFITLIVTDIAYLLNEFKSEEIDIPICATALIMLIYLTYLSFMTFNNVKSHNYKSTGCDPKDLLHDHFLYTKSKDEEREKYYYFFVIKDYKNRIDHNNSVNTNRWRIYNKTIKHLLFMPVVLIAIYLLACVWLNYICADCYAI